jgi:glycosyltransferase involved in cell wall biosynthesis
VGWRELIEKGVAGRAELGRAAIERIRSDFSLAHCVERYQEFFQAISAK